MQELDRFESKRKQPARATRENTKRTEGNKTVRGPLHGECVGEGEKRRPSLGFAYWPVFGRTMQHENELGTVMFGPSFMACKRASTMGSKIDQRGSQLGTWALIKWTQ